MPGGSCSIRAIWILGNLDAVVFSRSKDANSVEGSLNYTVFPSLPSDSELVAAFVERRKREGSIRGFGIRVRDSAKGSDYWVDDPIMRHIIRLYKNKEEERDGNLLWPLILHVKGQYTILVLPLVRHLKGIHGCTITGDTVEPEVVVNAAPSVGGLLDSLTGSIGISGISSRAKPVDAPVASPTPSGTAATGTVTLDAPKTGTRPLDRDAFRTFITSSMPFIMIKGFSASDLPPTDLKQPAWKPYGKQRLFTIHEIVHAALYDRDEIPDSMSISGVK